MNEKKYDRMERRHIAARAAAVKEGLTQTLASPSGRAFLWQVLELSGLNANPFTGNALQTSFNSGRQAVGQDLLSMIEDTNPHGYVNMLKENVEREEQYASTLKKEIEDDTDDE